jgi:predicted permease
VLLVGTGLLVRSLGNMRSADPGVDAEHIAWIGTVPSQVGLTGDGAGAAVDDLRRRIEALPGVTAVTIANRLPVTDRGGTSTTVIEGYDPPTGTGSVELPNTYVTPGYFEAVGIPLKTGRVFSAVDVADGDPVAIVNETAARRYWPGADPVGRRIRPQGAPDDWIQVIGVVADSKIRTLDENPAPLVYRPFGRAAGGFIYIMARTTGTASTVVDGLLRETRASVPALPVAAIGTLADHIDDGLASPRLVVALLGGFSAIAMLLTALGIHAVLSFGVARRSAELGIRMALGAARRSVIGEVVRDVLATVVIGLVAGLALAAAVAPRIEGLLYDVRWRDPAAFGGAALLLVAVAAVAAFLPARRAVAIDPVESLRIRP